MGGRAGHMSHLYDNPMLSFGELRDVFKKAAEGKLEGTEKTDGQNINISYSVKTFRHLYAMSQRHIPLAFQFLLLQILQTNNAWCCSFQLRQLIHYRSYLGY